MPHFLIHDIADVAADLRAHGINFDTSWLDPFTEFRFPRIGTAVFDGAVVNAGVVTGPTCVVNTNATVEHDCRFGTNVHIAPGATVSGGVTIGDHTFIGAGTVVIHGIRIVEGCMIGAGAVVTKDLTEPGTYVGTPARRVG